MENELKSCTGVLLRADLTGHGQPTLFGRWAGTPVQDFNYFLIMFYYIISTTYQKIGDLFSPVDISGFSHSVIKKQQRYKNLGLRISETMR